MPLSVGTTTRLVLPMATRPPTEVLTVVAAVMVVLAAVSAITPLLQFMAILLIPTKSAVVAAATTQAGLAALVGVWFGSRPV